MPTYTAQTTLTGKPQAEALSLAMEALTPEPTGVGVSEIQDGSGLFEVCGYFIDEPEAAGLALLATVYNTQPFTVLTVPDQDWVAKVRRALTPVYAGRFVVFGGHDRDAIQGNLIKLEIEAAMAFGTGHHGTTQGCLLAYDQLLKLGLHPQNVADIGAGTAVLAMAAARSGAPWVIASDIDPVATKTAQENVVVNQLGQRVRCLTSVGFRHPELRARAPYDLIFANILAGPLKRMASEMAAHSAPQSLLILSGILNHQARGVENTYAGYGFSRLHKRVIGEWSTLTLRR